MIQVDYLSENGTGTPLISACRSGYRGIVKLLLEKGAKVDLANVRQGLTPLIIAAHQ